MPGIFDPGIFDSGIFDTPASGGSGTFTAAAVIKVTRSGTFTANAVIGPAAGAFTVRAVIKRNQTSSFTANAIQKKTSQVPVVLVYPGYNSGAFNGLGDSNVLAGPIRITGGTQITIRVTAQSGGNLGIQAGATSSLANVTQNTWDDAPVGVHTFTVTGTGIRYVWVYSFSYDAGKTGAGTATTDQTTPTFTVDALRGKTTTGSFTANAAFIPRRFTADATILRVQTGSRPVDALIVPLRFPANAVIFRPDQLRTFTVSAWFALRIAGSFTANAIQKKTSIVPVTLVYPGVIGAGATANANIHAGPIRITPGTAITIRVSAQSDGNLGIVAGTTNVLASTTQNTFTNTPVGTFAPTVTGSSRFVWVYSFSFNGSRTGAGTATTDQTTPVFTVDAFKGYRFRADALIKASRTGSFTVDATTGPMFFRASAVIKATRSGSFTADARVINVPITGSFTANAIQKKTIINGGGGGLTQVFLDTFSTPTSAPPFNAGTPDIGNTWVWSDWDSNYNSAALSPTHVDAGGYLTVAATKYDSMYGAPSITTGELYLDFWVPASGDLNQTLYWYDTQWWAGYADQGANYQVQGPSANGTWPVTRSAWHRFHVIVDGATVRSHIWKVGDAEPSTYTTVQTTWPVAFTNTPTYVAQAPILDLYFAPSTEPLRVDNIIVYSSSAGGVGLAISAVKLRAQTGSTTANAVIKALGRTGSFTADAVISQGYFRASAVIASSAAGSFTVSALTRRTVTGSFTADAHYNRRVTGSFTANALLKVVGQPNSFTVDYATWSGVGPPPPLIGVPSRIFVNGVEITTHVMWKTASFSAKVNAQTGECTFDVVDRAHNLTFEFGDEVTLYIDGVLRWGGWIVQVNRQFPFPVLASPTTEARIFHIVGVDYNRFLDKRILHDSAHPNKTWNYPAGTYDNTIFNDLWSYFDTTGFTKNIHRVAAGVLDIPGVTARTGGNVAQGGFTMRDCLMHLSWDTGAIFYVTPQKVVTYVDADQVSNPYTLTDQPSGPMDVGFHDVRIIEDSTEMVNDAIVWGAGKGSNQVVESRYQSAASQADHGRWQAGNFTAGIYKQATANAVSRAAVEGSPVSLRGAKNPKRAVELLTWSPVFAIGDVVNFHDSQFFMPPADPDDAPTHDDVLPIRTMTITWPTPTAPLFALQLSWEVDAVWSFFDPWLPVGAPGLGGGGTGPGGLPTGGQDPPAGCSDAACGITDGFAGRTFGPAPAQSPGTQFIGDLWGVADIGVGWELDGIFPTALDAFHNSSNAYIADGVASFVMPQSNVGSFGSEVDATIDQFQGPASESYLLVRCRWTGSSPDSDGAPFGSIQWGPSVGNGDTYLFWNFNWSSSSWGAGNGNTIGVMVSGTTFPFIAQATTDFRDGAWRWYRVVRTSTTVTLTYWLDGAAEPSSPNLTLTLTGSPYTWSAGTLMFLDINGSQGAGSSNIFGALGFDIDYLDVGGVNRCDVSQFESFDRAVSISNGWGVASPANIRWQVSGSSQSVSNGVGRTVLSAGGASGNRIALGAAADPDEAIWLMQLSRALDGTSETISFFLDDSGSGGVTIVLGRRLDTGGYGAGRVGMQSDGAGVGASPGLNLTAPFYMAVTYVGSTIEYRMWAASGSRPSSALLTVNKPVGEPVDQWEFVPSLVFAVGTMTISFYSLDFDYAGRPCYTDCNDTGVMDSFDGRTTTPLVSPAVSNTAGWATSSSGGVWHTIASEGTAGGGTTTVSVAGGLGTVAMVTSVPPITDFSPFGTMQYQAPIACPGTIHWRFRPNRGQIDMPPQIGSAFQAWNNELSELRCDSNGSEILFRFYHRRTQSGNPAFFMTWVGTASFPAGGGGTSGDARTFDTFANTWYEAKVYVSPGEPVGYKVWESGTSEPSSFSTFPGVTTPTNFGSTMTTQIAVANPSFSTPSSNLTVDFDWFDAITCVATPASSGSSVPSGTHLTEDLTPLGTATGAPPTYPANSHWQATNSILPGSAILTVGGAIQYGNWSIYDAAAGIIQYDPTLVATTTVSLTYITNGAP